jgi:CO dehydrogenase/acetyl-CoA synthase epsilon subunit
MTMPTTPLLVGTELEKQEADPEKLMIDYRRRIEKCTVEKLVAEALADTASSNFQPETVTVKAYEHFMLFARSPLVESKLRERLWKMTEHLALKIASAAGSTNRDILDKTINEVASYLVRDSVRAFNALAREKVDMTGFKDLSADEKVVSTNIFFTKLHGFLVKRWMKAMCDFT